MNMIVNISLFFLFMLFNALIFVYKSYCDDDCRGFTKFSRTDYVQWKSENRIMSDGVNAKVLLSFFFFFFFFFLSILSNMRNV